MNIGHIRAHIQRAIEVIELARGPSVAQCNAELIAHYDLDALRSSQLPATTQALEHAVLALARAIHTLHRADEALRRRQELRGSGPC